MGGFTSLHCPENSRWSKAGGDQPEILHQAEFGERILASPAIVGDKFYLRTQSSLHAFGNPAARVRIMPGKSMRPNQTLDRRTRSTVNPVFHRGRPWRAPRVIGQVGGRRERARWEF